MAQFNIAFPYSSSSLSYVTASIASTTVVAADNNRGKFILNLSGSSRAYVALTSAPATTTAYQSQEPITDLSQLTPEQIMKLKQQGIL